MHDQWEEAIRDRPGVGTHLDGLAARSECVSFNENIM